VGVLHDQDLHQAISWLRNAQGQPVSDSELEAWYAGQVSEIGCRLVLGQTRVPVRRIRAVSVASRFGFDPDPMPSPGEPEC
jgi:hypothetical protein